MRESVARLSAHLAEVRTLAHVHAGRLAEEPQLERKLVIADHLHDDALAVEALAGLVREHGAEPDLGARDGGDDPRPRLIAELRSDVDRCDPLADAPVLRVLGELLQRQETHLEELALGSVSARLELPAREPYVAVDPAADDAADRALCIAELLARTSYEHPQAPWEAHAALARLAWDAARHAVMLDRAAARPWGARPVGLEPYRSTYREQPAERLRRLQTTTVLSARDGRTPEDMVHRIELDEARRARTLLRWARDLYG